MTKPRCVLSGVTYLVTRRCSERRFFLRPDPKVTQVFEYLLGWCANKYGIEIHAYVAMSNHYHLVLTDVRGKLPAFTQEFHSLVARAVNHLLGRWESFWDPRPTSAVALLGDGAVVEKMAYTLANPVRARLVGRARAWGGATSAGMRFGRARRIARPGKFFSEKMPEFVDLGLARPGWCSWLDDRELRCSVDRRVRELEVECGKLGPAIGMQAVLDRDWSDSPAMEGRRRELSPTVAGGERRTRVEWQRRAEAWLGEYRAALGRFVDGVRDVEFPAGTWWMCVRLGCRVAPG
jgi:putative transposase